MAEISSERFYCVEVLACNLNHYVDIALIFYLHGIVIGGN